MKIAKIIITSLFLIASAFVGYHLYSSVKVKVDEIEDIKIEEKAVKIKLEEIRKAQIAYNSLYGKYCDNWDSLAVFIKDSAFVVTDKKEKQVKIEYTVNGQSISVDSTIFTIDTVGIVSVIDSLFTPNYDYLNISKKPGYDTTFNLSTVYQPNNAISYIEVVDPNPINPERQKHGKLSPLKIGSLERSSTKGNWEKK